MAICPNCGEDNPDRARFCLACAAPLAPAPTQQAERKVVSVIFVDLVGFTAESDTADPEDVHATLKPYHARVRNEIEWLGGVVEKYVGDAGMAVFGAPVAHEADAERAPLKETPRRVRRDESVQLVTLVGEAGVGKTRLLRELGQWLDDEPDIVYWRQGRCLPYGEGITFWALGEIVKAQAGILESDDARAAARKLAASVEAVVPDAAERDWIRARLAPLVGVATDAAGTSREESFTAWRGYLEAVAAQRPLVLLFEDLHWADEPLFEFLGHLVDWSLGVPMLVLCTARPELYELHE